SSGRAYLPGCAGLVQLHPAKLGSTPCPGQETTAAGASDGVQRQSAATFHWSSSVACQRCLPAALAGQGGRLDYCRTAPACLSAYPGQPAGATTRLAFSPPVASTSARAERSAMACRQRAVRAALSLVSAGRA